MKKLYNVNEIFIDKSKAIEPKPDVARCSNCGFKAKAYKFPIEYEGDYEGGYYPVPVCPKCEDDGCVDDYYMSFWQFVKYKIWEWKNDRSKR